MTATTSLSGRSRRVADILTTWPRQRVRLDELWRILDQADPTTRAASRRRHALSELISELVAAGLVILPSTRSYDHSEVPALPKFLILQRDSATAEPGQATVWHPALSWVPRSNLIRTQTTTMERVNEWLHNSRDQFTVPARERSLEVFGEEKALDRLIGTTLFGPGRLTLELLRCRRVAPPLLCESVGGGDVLLIVENSDTFDSLITVLRERTGHPVGLVGWGAGTGFEASVLSIARIERSIAEIRYFGDLDENGLRIPASAARLAASADLPAVRPAASLYSAMFQRASPQAGQRRLTADAAAVMVDWLQPEHRAGAAMLLLAGERLAQESVGLSYLSSHHEWLKGF